MDGIIVVNKEKDYTSRDVVNKVGRIIGTKKIGHTGTLDPLATGVLVLCVGRATKLVELLTSTIKEYEAEVTLGIDTDTLDITGNVLEERQGNYTKEEIISALKSMHGNYMQEVPNYSAVKINGKKLYEYARDGEHIDLPKREVNIIDIELISDVINKDGKTIFSFKTTVSKGTYIRSLIRDIAFKLNTVGVMSELNRVKQGCFELKDSFTLSEIESGKYKLISMDEALNSYFTVLVTGELEKQVKNGCKLNNIYNKEYVLFKSNNVLALYKDENGVLKMYKYLG